MAKLKLPEEIRRKFVAAGRRGGLAGSRSSKSKAGIASSIAKKKNKATLPPFE